MTTNLLEGQNLFRLSQGRFNFSFSIQKFFREYLYFIHSLTEDATFLIWPYLKGSLIDYWHGTGSRLCFLTPVSHQNDGHKSSDGWVDFPWAARDLMLTYLPLCICSSLYFWLLRISLNFLLTQQCIYRCIWRWFPEGVGREASVPKHRKKVPGRLN